MINLFRQVGGAVSYTARSVATGFKAAVIKIGGAIEEADDRRKAERLAELRSFKQMSNGIDCNVSASEFIAHVDVKWVYQTIARSNDLTGERYTERVRVDAMEAFHVPKSTFFDEDRDNYLQSSDYCHGVLFRNSEGRLFLITFRGGKSLTTFYSTDEEQLWCEDHLSYDKYKAVYGR